MGNRSGNMQDVSGKVFKWQHMLLRNLYSTFQFQTPPQMCPPPLKTVFNHFHNMVFRLTMSDKPLRRTELLEDTPVLWNRFYISVWETAYRQRLERRDLKKKNLKVNWTNFLSEFSCEKIVIFWPAENDSDGRFSWRIYEILDLKSQPSAARQG